MSEDEQIENDILENIGNSVNIIIPIKQKVGLTGIINYGIKYINN